MLKRVILSCVLGLAWLPAPVSAQAGFANMIDHIHLAAPDQAKGAEWYHTHFGGELTPEGPDRVMFGTPGDRAIGAANFRRLLRSAQKLRAQRRIAVTDAELSALAAAAGHAT